MEINIREAYDTLKTVIGDISKIVSSLSQWKTNNLINKYREGLGAINLICLKVLSEVEVAHRARKNVHLTVDDRRNIVESIITLSKDLNVIIESDAIRLLLGPNRELAEQVYLKMYGEKEDYLPENIWSDESEFLCWIRTIPSYITGIFKELDTFFKN